LDLNNGTLAYHLHRLENESVIKSAMDGAHRRYYPAGMKVPEPKSDTLTEVQRIIITRISETPGISQRDLGALMGLSSATVNYHIERLLAKGVIRRERAGMRYRCFVSEAVPGKPPAQEN
jgi:predicted transcriptional regulator